MSTEYKGGNMTLLERFFFEGLNDEAAQLTSMPLYPIAVVMHITHRLRSEPVKQSAAFNRVITL